MRWLRYRNEMVAAGTNSMMRRLLESGKGPSLQSPLAYDLRRSSQLAMDRVRQPDRTPTAPSAPASAPPEWGLPEVAFRSLTPPEVFQPEYGWPEWKKVERWLCDAEGKA